jgi:hypothetical protein
VLFREEGRAYADLSDLVPVTNAPVRIPAGINYYDIECSYICETVKLNGGIVLEC